jgi:hypothetical protein
MSISFRVATVLGCAALAFAFTIMNVRADAPECEPIASLQSEISALGGGKLAPVSRDKLLFARGLFSATPPASAYPPGEDGMIAMFPEGQSTIVFVDKGMACGKIGMSSSMTKILLQIDGSI